jgi:hypothetical protein
MDLKDTGCEVEDLDSTGSEQDPVVCSCGQGNEPSGSIKGGEFLDQLRYYQLLKDCLWSMN